MYYHTKTVTKMEQARTNKNSSFQKVTVCSSYDISCYKYSVFQEKGHNFLPIRCSFPII